MGSLLEELARRETTVRQRIEEIGELIAELNGLLEARKTGCAAGHHPGDGGGDPGRGGPDCRGTRQGAGFVEVSEAVEAAPPQGVVSAAAAAGKSASVLPAAYRDAVEILTDAAGAMRAGQIATAMGLAVSAAKRGVRSSSSGWSSGRGHVLCASSQADRAAGLNAI